MMRAETREGKEKRAQAVHNITETPSYIRDFVFDNFREIRKERKKGNTWREIASAVKKYFEAYTSIYSLAEDLSTAFCRIVRDNYGLNLR